MSESDPLVRFDDWYKTWLKTSNDPEPAAMTLATATSSGMPSVRIVLLKAYDARGFVFYTNMNSRKGQELLANEQAGLCFHWPAMGRQVRACGPTHRVSDDEADAYWNSRAKASRIGAIASDQSASLESRDALLDRVRELDAQFPDDDVPRPAHWTGTRLAPVEVEFWQQGAYRLHDRFRYTRPDANSDMWTMQRLNP